MTRHWWVLLHRYAGLAMTVFLIIVALTGSLLAFYSELEHLISPQLYAAPPPGAVPLDAATLAERAEALVPQAKVTGVYFGEPDRASISMTPRIDPATGQAYAIGFSQLFLDPVTGAELGRRSFGDLSQGWINFMPFIYKLHYALALDMPGVWALGVVALVWTLDCFVGFYLTLPMRRRPGGAAARGEARSFWQRWKPAWKIKWRGSRFRIHFDLHRAGSLWLWAALLVFAWSSVYMNLWDSVYTWTMRAVSDYHPPWTELQVLPKPLENPRLGWREALTTGQRLMAEHAVREGFSVETPVGLGFDSEHGVYRYSVRSSRDIQDREGSTQVHFDADTGEMRLLLLPSGQHSGNTITNWLYALHMANVFGLPWRIFVCVLGLAIVMLSITGVIIWLRKRRAARHQREHRVHTPAARTPFVNELVGSNRRLG